MKEFKGTEGDWEVVEGGSAGFAVVSKSAPRVRRNIAACGGQRRKENATLIAAAPRVLKALQNLYADYKQMADSGDAGNWRLEDTDVGIEALDAMKQALGEQP